MEFFETVLKFASMAVTGFGGSIAIGGIIIAVGILLVPQLSSLLTV